ncbi:Hsp33 family molecular chaperone HslO [Thioalkalivibrio thiocyanodenitrificans]|uniref:Hsp33 family molecular chaperone HslO n=1 Tax=Thioalkalivibrio thiocyanodenitrificans TaxID=243063 RepID=UPI0003757B14|nr:Hsp33 family molecular chaperone HslO [Thioalkalivibrio thiocyanodenitrificans]
MTDTINRFILETTHVRGEWVHLDATWQALLERYDYPPVVRGLLGQALAAVALLSATIKFEGSLILQVTGNGPLNLLVVQAGAHGTVRGLARWRSEVPDADLSAQFGDGRMVITIDPGEGRERYQGVVPLEGSSLSEALEGYFTRSEQLPTRLWLAADGQRAAGLLLQALPGEQRDPDAFDRAVILADTVADEELLEWPVETLLHRLYHEEDVRLLEGGPVSFRCGCSRERVADMLRNLGRAEVEGILADDGVVEVHCEFCNAGYRFDAVDAEQLFAEGEQPPGTRTRH